mmetsp:Transcript_25923/g.46111  ORF Transcript_25923/g.46111 Transcript_25923/m.46111 type:complete len:85 (+) Transcript_25923:138-392(+)
MWQIAAGILVGAAVLSAAHGLVSEVSSASTGTGQGADSKTGDGKTRGLPYPEEGGPRQDKWTAELWKEAASKAEAARRWGKKLK